MNAPIRDFTLFLGKFLKHGTAIASVAPSSRWLSRLTVRNIDWARARALVELGAGTGPITRVIAERRIPNAVSSSSSAIRILHVCCATGSQPCRTLKSSPKTSPI